MRRRLALAAALLPAAWITTAAALGLGDIDVHSGLNQPFSATIPLNATSAEAAGVRVGLASNSDFERAGVDRIGVLSSFKFDVKTEGATPRIELVSSQAVREPMVVFLIEVRSAGNRIVREYTVFLDPPDYAAPVPVPVPTVAAAPTRPAVAPQQPPQPSASSATSDFYETAAEAERGGFAPVPRSTDSSSTATTPILDEPARLTRSEVQVRPEQPTTSGQQPGRYGPVRPGETLWSVASKLRPGPAVSMDQMLLGLYRANPRAFDGGIDGLMKGMVLTVPGVDELTAVSPAQARDEVRVLRSGGATMPAKKPAPSPQPTVAPSVIPTAAPTPTPEPTTAPEPASSDAAVETPAEPAPITLPEDSFADDGAETPAETGMADLPPDLPLAEPEQGDAELMPSETPADATGAEHADEGLATSEPELAAGEEAALPPAVEEEIFEEPAPASESGLLESLLIPLILGVLLIGGIGFLIAKVLARRKGQQAGGSEAAVTPKPASISKPDFAATVAATAGAAEAAAPELEATQEQTQRFDETLEAAAPQGDADEGLADVDLPAAPATEAVTPPPAEPEPVDFDLTGQFESQTVQIDLDANDPVSEADFHLAYGLYDEAALLLQQAAEKEPQRSDIRVKLAETYFAAGKADEFLQCAGDIKPMLSPAEWQKISILGQQLCPDEELFKATDGGAVESADLDLDLSSAEPAATDAAAADGAEPERLDQAAPPSPAADEPAGLEFNLEDFELPPLESDQAAPATPAESAGEDRGEGLDFDLSQFDLGAGDAEPAAAEADAQADTGGNAVDFDLGDVSLETSDDATAAPASEAEAVLELPELGAGDDIAEPPAQTSGLESESVEPTEQIQLDDVDLGDASTSEALSAGDEAGTKLDLARAYVDMGDNDMAKSLLDEVVEQGSDEQKREAQSLLQRLG